MIESFFQDWWGQITGLVVLIAWLNRQQTRAEARIESLEKKVEVLYTLHNDFTSKLVNRGLDQIQNKK